MSYLDLLLEQLGHLQQLSHLWRAGLAGCVFLLGAAAVYVLGFAAGFNAAQRELHNEIRKE
jgi:hypothetical protein